MIRRRLPVLVVSLMLLGLGGLAVSSAEEGKKMTDAERDAGRRHEGPRGTGRRA
ncbi:MAG: hypothetical protein NTY65_14355 [Planctomycetota bacterium]|nr:hypothetical protein [Planctomycetota bacterium]